MPDDSTAAATRRSFIVEPPAGLGEALRYVVALAIVAAVGASALALAGRAASNDEATEVDNAVLVDLPPAQASSQPASDATEGPIQQAAQASAAQQELQQIEPPKTPEERETAPAEKVVDEPTSPVMPNPPDVLERKRETSSPPKPIVTPATQARDERTPAGTQTPTKSEASDRDEGRHRASAHALTLWQKSLVRQLETAKRLFDRETRAGRTVKVAFEIDGNGALLSERVAQSSGAPSLDGAALLLVRRAAPFPAPPPGSTRLEMSFVVPIRFR